MPKTSKTKKVAGPKIPLSFTKALAAIHAKGFTHIKVELEARLARGNNSVHCDKCREGWNNCNKCGSKGFTSKNIKIAPFVLVTECRHCEGDGAIECGNCNGRGYTRGGADVEWCQQYLESHLSKETRKALVYGRFYDDGSVDSEYTFTLPIKKAHLVIEVMEAFQKVAQGIGNGLSEENAGMHISVLPSGVYPCDSDLLKPEYMKNFRTEVTKLLPALYFVAGHTSSTRSLRYRSPQVSNYNKYVAIYTHGDTSIEYRIFDPCFGNLEVFYDKVEVIAATLKYYSTEKVNINYENFRIKSTGSQSFMNWFGTLENYDVLLKTIKSVKPAKSLIKLKTERGLKELTKKNLNAQIKTQRKELLERYEQEKVRHERDKVAVRTQAIEQLKDILSSNSRRYLEIGFIADWIRSLKLPLPQIVGSTELLEKFVESHGDDFGVASYYVPYPDFAKWIKNYSNQSRSAFVLNSKKPIDDEDEFEDED